MLVPAALRTCDVRDLGAMRWGAAYALQAELVGQRQRGEIGDQLLLVEHPHVVTMGRNGQSAHLLASAEVLAATGIEYHETNRGGDVTYHGPGQLVGYPIVQLNEWKRDVHAYVRALEEVIIRVLADFGLTGERVAGATGVWTGGAKICAIGVHLSRWVSSHGFALNVTTDLQYFQYIVPCGRQLGVAVSMDEVKSAVRRRFAEVYEYQ
jgi:lipoyl(octanoyl) transferase